MYVIATLSEEKEMKVKIESKYGVKAFDSSSFETQLAQMDQEIHAMQAADMNEFGVCVTVAMEIVTYVHACTP